MDTSQKRGNSETISNENAPSMKKILITGITGFVGSHLAEYCLEKNHKVYGLKRWHLSKFRNIRHIVDEIELFDCDLTDPVSIRKIITTNKPDSIFHLAAE